MDKNENDVTSIIETIKHGRGAGSAQELIRVTMRKDLSPYIEYILYIRAEASTRELNERLVTCG